MAVLNWRVTKHKFQADCLRDSSSCHHSWIVYQSKTHSWGGKPGGKSVIQMGASWGCQGEVESLNNGSNWGNVWWKNECSTSVLYGDGLAQGDVWVFIVHYFIFLCNIPVFHRPEHSEIWTEKSKAVAFAPGSKSSKILFLVLKIDLQAIPISTKNICLWAQFLASSLKTVGAIDAYI